MAKAEFESVTSISQLTGSDMFSWFESLRLYAEDTVANDVLYLNLCWARGKGFSQAKQQLAKTFVKTLLNIEILNCIKNSLLRYSINLLDIDRVNKINEILIENDEQSKFVSTNYEKQLKELIKESLPESLFVKSNLRNKLQELTASITQSEAMKLFEEKVTDKNDVKSLRKLAKNVRKEVLSQDWQFSSYRMHFLFLIFMKCVIFGSSIDFTNYVERIFAAENLLQTKIQFIS